MRSATNHYGTLKGGHRTRTRMRHTPQLNWRLSPNSRGSQSHKNHKVGARLHNLIGGSQLSREPPKLREQHGPSRALQVPKRTSSRAPKYPRVTSFSTSTSTYHRGELKPMQPMQWARTQEVLKILHSQIPPKQLMLLGGEERKNKEEHQIPPRSRSKSFPSLRGEIDW